jgi:heat shock protein HtpX
MGTAIVMAAIGVVGCVTFVGLGRARGSRYAVALGLAFAGLAAVILVVVAGGYVDCTHREACPAGLGVIKVAYFGLLAAIALMLLGGLGVLSKVPAAREGGLGRDLGLTARIVAVVMALGVLYLVMAFWFLALLIAAAADGEWAWVAVLLVFGGAPVTLLAWQAFHAERLALRAAGARVLEPGQEPGLQGLVGRLALVADLPVPRVAVAPSSEANAFSVGLTPRRAAIVVTTELLRRLDEGQLKAVIAHELSHIANRDGAVMTLVAAPAMFGSLLFRVRGAILIFWFYVPVWAAGLVLVWAMSRAREFYADRGSAQLTGAPEQLMSALAELGGKTATRDLRGVAIGALCIVRPGRRRWYDPDFSHPAIEKRIAHLETLARQLARPRTGR